MPARSTFLLTLAALLCLAHRAAQAQTETAPNDSVRVSVTINQDGSRTSYQFDPVNHKATSTTTERDGKARGKIEYQIDDAGRFASGRIFGADGKFLFSAVYKYDAAGHLLEESRLGKDNQPAGKIVYDYDAAGRQTGYSILDRNGKIVGKTTPPKPTPKPRR